MGVLWDAFRFVFCSLYLGTQVFLSLGLYLARRRERWLKVPPVRPLVSVIIPARNEESRIGVLLDSLKQQDYPAFEIILINDRSTDATPRLLEDFKISMPQGMVKILNLNGNPGPNFKQYGLGQGYAEARGEFILFTDADCLLQSGWISSMVSHLSTAGVGLVIGPVYKRVSDRSFLQYYQAFDHALRYLYLAGSTGLGFAAGGFGNNLIFRKAELDALGGYSVVPYSVTEDAALISLFRTKTACRVHAALESSSRVLTLPEEGARDFIRQGLRWNNGALFAPDIATRLGFSLFVGSISLCTLALLACPWVPGLWLFPATTFLGMAFNALLTARIAGSSLPSFWRWRFLSILATPFYFAVLTLLGVFGMKVRWKDANLHVDRSVP